MEERKRTIEKVKQLRPMKPALGAEATGSVGLIVGARCAHSRSACSREWIRSAFAVARSRSMLPKWERRERREGVAKPSHDRFRS